MNKSARSFSSPFDESHVEPTLSRLERLRSMWEKLMEIVAWICIPLVCIFVVFAFYRWSDIISLIVVSCMLFGASVGCAWMYFEVGKNWFALTQVFFWSGQSAVYGTFCAARLYEFFIPPPVAPDPGDVPLFVWASGYIVAFLVTLTCAIGSRRELLTPQDFDDRWLSSVIRIIYGAVGAALLFLWAIIGFVVWILLMARAFNRLLMAVLHHSLTGAGEWIGDAQRCLDIAAPFYANGFNKITAGVREQWSKSWMPQRFTRSAAIEVGAPSLLVAVISLAVGAVSLFAWAIIGLVFWIPLLVRTTVLFFVDVLRDSIIGSDEGARRAHRSLDVAVPIYVDGFVKITEALRRPRTSEMSAQRDTAGWGWIALETIWAVGMWSVTLLALAGFAA